MWLLLQAFPNCLIVHQDEKTSLCKLCAPALRLQACMTLLGFFLCVVAFQTQVLKTL